MVPQRTSLNVVRRRAVLYRVRRSLGRALALMRATAFAMSFVAGTSALAAKTDVVVLDNGDRFTGEIKGMSRGQLDFKTDDAGRFSIQWIKIARITSIHAFEIEMASGAKYYGTLRSPADKQVWVGDVATDVFAVDDIIVITPMSARFWSRVKAYLDLGFTLAKANNALTLSGDGSFAYRGQHFGGSLTFNTYLQDDANSTAVSQLATDLTGMYYFDRNWRAQLQFGLDINNELDLLLRLDIGGGVAYPVVRNEWTEFWVSGGLVGVRELYTSGTPVLSLAAYAGADWEAFRYDSPKLDLTISQIILPVITELWRFRGTTQAKLKYELFADFNVGFNMSFTFDTKPPDVTASKTDYLMSITIGWSYRN